MKLTRIMIYERGYSSDKDGQKYSATIEFSGTAGKIELNLPAELSERVIAVCADMLIETSQEAARDMKAEIIEAGKPQIEGPKQ